MTGSCSTCSAVPGPAAAFPATSLPARASSPTLSQTFPRDFCLSCRTQTWIFNTHKAQGSAGDRDLRLACCRGEEAAGTRYSSQYTLRSGCSAPSTRRVMLSLGHPAAAPGNVPGREGTGQSCRSVGLRSRLSSQPFQERVGPTQPTPAPLHEALTLQMFRDSAHSRDSQQARNSGWRAAASCGICQHRRKVLGRQMQPLLSAAPPATRWHVPMGTVTDPLPIAASAATTLLAAGPPASPCKAAARSTQGKRDPLPSDLQETSSRPAVPATALQPAQQGCNKPEATTSFTIASNRLEGSKPALPGLNTVSSLFSIQFHAVEFTGMSARSQILKSHTLILHKHQLLSLRSEPRHSPCSANASTSLPLPARQDSPDPRDPQGIRTTGAKLNHEAMSAFRKPAAWCREQARFMDKNGADTSRAAGWLGARPRHPTHASPGFLPERGSCSLSHPITTDKNSVQQLEIPAPNATGVCFPNSLSSLHPTNPQLPSGDRCQPHHCCQGHAKITTTGARVSYGKVTGRFITGRSPGALPWVPPALSTPLAAARQAESSSCLQITDASEPPAPLEGLGGIKGTFNFGRGEESLAGWTGDPFQPVAHNPASSLHSFPTGTPNSHHPCSTQPGNPHVGAEQAKNNQKEPAKLPHQLPSCPTTTTVWV